MIKDLTGQIFGKLKVLSFANKDNGRYKWNCLCSCGKETIVESYNLKTCHVRSCGCIKNVQKRLSTTAIYNIWGAMIQRCYDTKCSTYSKYGGKGITVCERWQNSFLDFYEDMGERPNGMTLDRIDFNGNYCKDNCRWATMKQQQRNRSDNHIIEALGKKQTLAEWSEETGIKQETIRARLKSNWLVEKALTKKVGKWRKK